MVRIAIIGAGVAGVSLAHRLGGQHQVVLFEKSRGLGGRLATRRREGRQWDHGAPFLTARSPEFRDFLERVCGGSAVPWSPRLTTFSLDQAPYKRNWFEPHWVGVGAMSRLLRPALGDLTCHFQRRVDDLLRTQDGWILSGPGWQSEAFDRVVLTCPAVQAFRLLPQEFPGREAVGSVVMWPCFALMLCLDSGASAPSWQAAVIRGEVLSWAAWEPSKPGRPDLPGLTLHARNDWSRRHLDEPPEWVEQQMLEEFLRLSGWRGVLERGQADLHRWRYAVVEKSLTELREGPPCLWSSDLGLGVCGDWCHGRRAESAFLSARALAEAIEGVVSASSAPHEKSELR